MLLFLLLVGVAFLVVLVAAFRTFPRLCTWLAVFILGSITGMILMQIAPVFATWYGWAWLAFVAGAPIYWLVKSIHKQTRWYL